MERETIRGSEVGIQPSIIDELTLSLVIVQVHYWAGAIAVLVIVIGAFFYVTANGDAQKVERGKMAVLGGAIGLAVIMVAFVITQLVIRVAENNV